MEKLNRLVGLTKVKAGMAELRAMVEFDQWRRKLLPAAKSLMGQSFHMQFLGNPGTGKTVVARLVGKLLVEMGVIKKKDRLQTLLWSSLPGTTLQLRSSNVWCLFPHQEKDKDEAIFHEVSRADLVAEYKGQTAPKALRAALRAVLGAVSKAIGGVLFVDEAYSLKKEGKDSFGQEAVDTLIKEIEDKRDQVVAIFAGYEKEMETFFEANPGFKSRVPFKFYFDDYTCAELNHISGIFLEDKGFTASDEAKKWIDRTVRFSTGCCDDQGSDCEALLGPVDLALLGPGGFGGIWVPNVQVLTTWAPCELSRN
ncbi:Stage V sporulation protein K [Durusdinium trenchii]|uniref:Stage V sporulation protein K n=1 Tax=Durusdinium trenchii TaxID=1381693 RepID=A0ABP0JBQ8_9DINO